MLICFCLDCYFLKFVSSKCSGTWQKGDIGARYDYKADRLVLFSGIVSIIPKGASSQLRSPSRVNFNSQPLRVKKQTPSFASSSLTDTQYLRVAANPPPPSQVPVCTRQTRAIKRREIKGEEQSPELWSSPPFPTFHAFCILFYWTLSVIQFRKYILPLVCFIFFNILTIADEGC